MESNRLNEDVAVVTGAGRNIGEAIAKRFAEEGAKVAVVDLNEERAASTKKDIIEAGNDAISITADVSDEGDVAEMVGRVEDEFGPISILVNNAAIKEVSRFLEMSAEMFDKTLAVNLRGMFLCTRECAKSMRDVESGRIVNISSTSGHNPEPNSVAYGTSKGGVINFTRSTASALGQYGIRVNTLTPTRTGKKTLPANSNTATLKDDDVTDEEIREQILVGRIPEPLDQANAALFLVSDEGEFVNGTELKVTGGRAR